MTGPPRTGAVLLHDGAGPSVLERFTCADTGDGWTWSSSRSSPLTGALLGRLHLLGAADGTVRRLHVEHGAWVLRGGVVGREVLWRRGEAEREVVADGFWGTSPAYAVAAVRRLRLAVGEQARLRLVAVLEPVLATRTVDLSFRRTSEDGWQVADLATGEQRELRVQDGLVVGGTGLTLTEV